MLKARAITEVSRDACSEALFGVIYTAEELGAEHVDEDGALTDLDGPKRRPAACPSGAAVRRRGHRPRVLEGTARCWCRPKPN